MTTHYLMTIGWLMGCIVGNLSNASMSSLYMSVLGAGFLYSIETILNIRRDINTMFTDMDKTFSQLH